MSIWCFVQSCVIVGTVLLHCLVVVISLYVNIYLGVTVRKESIANNLHNRLSLSMDN